MIFLDMHVIMSTLFFCLDTHIYLHTFVLSSWICGGLVGFCKMIHPTHQSGWGVCGGRVAIRKCEGFQFPTSRMFHSFGDFVNKLGEICSKISWSQLKTRWDPKNTAINGVKALTPIRFGFFHHPFVKALLYFRPFICWVSSWKSRDLINSHYFPYNNGWSSTQ